MTRKLTPQDRRRQIATHRALVRSFATAARMFPQAPGVFVSTFVI
jgi:hypothetical protein